ncbi:MAG: hypothetical protein GX639_21305 [Fibrobacter sp.]|nr:hypothetical protein [Fibrobacter sp.]
MSLDNILNAAVDNFKQTLYSFCQNNGTVLDKIDSGSFAVMTKGLMEAAKQAGRTGLCTYLKENDTVAANIAHNGTTFRFKGTSAKELLTLFGTISIDRAMYYNEIEGGSYYFPLDNAISIEKNDFATLEVREMILFATASCVPAELHSILKKCSLCNPSTTAIQNIINKDGQAIEEYSKQLSTNVFQTVVVPQQTCAIVASLDGANVLLREAGAKKGRKNIRPVEQKNQSTSTSYHNAMVGAVSFYGSDTENKPKRLESLYIARMPQEKTVTFKEDFERMVTQMENNCNEQKIPVIKVLLTDAHLMIKGFAKENKKLQEYEMLVDFFHTTEHLSRAAEAIFGKNTDLSQHWYDKWREKMKSERDTPAAIIRSMKGYLTRCKLSANRKKELCTEITFFRKNKHLMKYPDFIARNLPIGSGPIEAAAKTIIKQRMCRSGMRWTREKGQYVLTIRAFVQSGLWDSVWNNYKKLRIAS